jgi:hypothetical protein
MGCSRLSKEGECREDEEARALPLTGPTVLIPNLFKDTPKDTFLAKITPWPESGNEL